MLITAQHGLQQYQKNEKVTQQKGETSSAGK